MERVEYLKHGLLRLCRHESTESSNLDLKDRAKLELCRLSERLLQITSGKWEIKQNVTYQKHCHAI